MAKPPFPDINSTNEGFFYVEKITIKQIEISYNMLKKQLFAKNVKLRAK